MAEKVRLTLDLSTRMDQTLEDLARETGSSKSEVLRQAIKIAEATFAAKREKRRVGATGVDTDKLEREFVF